VRGAVEKICARFEGEYWLQRDSDGKFPEEFYLAFADDGWLAICIPQAYVRSGLGVTEAALMMQTVAQSGAGLSGASTIHMNIFGLNPVAVYASEEQKRRMLPPIAAGKEKAYFAVTEPNADLETAKLQSRVEPRADVYVIDGAKIWISTAQVADKMLILARTAPIAEGHKPTEGTCSTPCSIATTLRCARSRRWDARRSIPTLFIDGLEVPAADRIGEDGRGFEYLLHGLNPERILVAAEAIGLGRAALARASTCAKERVVFGRSIGKNQAIQHPLAECWMELEAVDLMMLKAAWQYDRGVAYGPAANAAKYLAAEAGFKTCQTAIPAHGGYSYANEYHVECYLHEIMIAKLAPVSPQLILCFIAEKVLGLPKSY